MKRLSEAEEGGGAKSPKTSPLIGTKSITTIFALSPFILSQVYDLLFINIGDYDSGIGTDKLTPLYL